MATDKYDFLRQGIYVSRMTECEALQEIAKSLYPVKSGHELRRIGAFFDGGYLVPDDLQGVRACFSPGVSDTASFEGHLLENYGIPSHLADYSVDTAPTGFNPKSFKKKFIGPLDDGNYLTLDSWVEGANEAPGDLILQMDIEGSEYLSILAVSQETLKKFRIIIIEIHDIESWGEVAFFRVVENFFKKLLMDFCIVHNHPNNCCGVVDLGGFLAPRVFELTLLRKDRVVDGEYRFDFPHPLDRPNLLDRPDLILPRNWYHE